MKAPGKDISPLLHAAVAAQQGGNTREARRLYEQALRAAPRNADALHLLGLTWLDEGQAERGLQLIRRAIAYRPDYLEAINNIAIELAKLDRHAEARGFLEKALALNPAQPDIHYNLGRSLNALGAFDAALASYDRALALRPGHAETWNNRAVTLLALKDTDGAIASCDRAVALRPDYHEAWTHRAICLRTLDRPAEALASLDNAIFANPDFCDAWLTRGHCLHDLRQYEDALAAYDKAIALKPGDAGGWTGKGIALHGLKRYADALACQDKALDISPGNFEAVLARGAALQKLGRLEDALACAGQADAVQPGHFEALALRASVLQDQRRWDEALACQDAALRLNPEDATTRVNRAYALLTTGRFTEAWPDLEYRWRKPDYADARPAIGVPEWNGEDPAGRHMLVYAEQGLGDVVMFLRYALLLRERAARLTLLADRRLHALLRGAGDIALVSEPDTVRGADYQCAMMSLPMHLAPGVADIPRAVPYLHADQARADAWRARIGTDGFRAGISWQGNPAGDVDRGRSFPLRRYEALAGLAGLRLISLQKGFGSEQLADLPPGLAVETLGADFDAGADAFVDTAAAMQALDLVITSDTAIAHVAGALGRPVWVALQHAADWRWLEDRTDSPWYPSMRLFRQPVPGDWDGVFAAIRAALESR
jgi:tetratricopeptide (TPR) repeat protein